MAFALRLVLAYNTINNGINNNIQRFLASLKGLTPTVQSQIYYNIEAYKDFKALYVPWLNLLKNGVIPYVGGNYIVAGSTNLHYPPLFLYSLLPIYLIGGQFGVAMLIALADSLSAALVYLIAEMLSKNRKIAILAGFAYAFLPFALLYEGVSLLNIEPMLFLVLLSLYLLHKNKLLSSAIMLALAVGMRQEALFLLPIYALKLSDNNRPSLVLPAIAFSAVLLIMSIPFLLSKHGVKRWLDFV